MPEADIERDEAQIVPPDIEAIPDDWGASSEDEFQAERDSEDLEIAVSRSEEILRLNRLSDAEFVAAIDERSAFDALAQPVPDLMPDGEGLSDRDADLLVEARLGQQPTEQQLKEQYEQHKRDQELAEFVEFARAQNAAWDQRHEAVLARFDGSLSEGLVEPIEPNLFERMSTEEFQSFIDSRATGRVVERGVGQDGVRDALDRFTRERIAYEEQE